jgi:septum site-determining protein MinC
MVTSAVSAPVALLDLKGTSLAALTLVVRTADLHALARELASRLGDTPDAFANDPLVIDLTPLARAEADHPPDSSPTSVIGDLFDQDPASRRPRSALDVVALVRLLKRHGLQPVAVRGGSAAQTGAALAAGLADASGGGSVAPPSNRKAAASPEPVREVEVIREVIREVEVIREIAAPPPQTVVIDKPLRSGQQVYAKGADLVVLALVNHGAEVIADGNIHVYAPLRGRAIAGARGNTGARIFANSLEAELVSIAGIYRTTEEPLPDSVRGKPAHVRLEGEKLIMEPLGE